MIDRKPKLRLIQRVGYPLRQVEVELKEWGKLAWRAGTGDRGMHFNNRILPLQSAPPATPTYGPGTAPNLAPPPPSVSSSIEKEKSKRRPESK